MQKRLDWKRQELHKVLDNPKAHTSSPGLRDYLIGGKYESMAIYDLVLGQVAEARGHFNLAASSYELAALHALEPGSTQVTHRLFAWFLGVSCALASANQDLALRTARHRLEQHPKSEGIVVGNDLQVALALPMLVLGEDAMARPFLERIREKSPSFGAAALALISRDVETLRKVLEQMLLAHSKSARNARRSDHGLPSTFVCTPALSLAVLAIWRGLLEPSLVPRRDALLTLDTWRHTDMDGSSPFDLHVDYLPQALLPEPAIR